MKRRSTVGLLAALLVLGPAAAWAAPTLSGRPTAAEKPFVTEISTDLNGRFGSPAAATKAGYIRYTNEDDTGAISYANRQWTSVDAEHPSQLWYDVHGNLLGADYSVPYDAAHRPDKFNLDPSRWQKFGMHDHYGLIGPNNTTIYGATSPKKFTAIGANSNAPTAADLVKMGVAKNPSDVRFVFVFPAIWDVSVWIDGNPAGAFAEKNPNVKPVNPPKGDDDSM